MVKRKLSLNRAIILGEIKDNEPIAIYKIVKNTKLPRSTVIYCLNELKASGLVLEKSAEDINGKRELGSPLYLTTNKANPLLKSELKAITTLINLFK